MRRREEKREHNRTQKQRPTDGEKHEETGKSGDKNAWSEQAQRTRQMKDEKKRTT